MLIEREQNNAQNNERTGTNEETNNEWKRTNEGGTNEREHETNERTKGKCEQRTTHRKQNGSK
jgi:hypothetical protein